MSSSVTDLSGSRGSHDVSPSGASDGRYMFTDPDSPRTLGFHAYLQDGVLQVLGFDGIRSRQVRRLEPDPSLEPGPSLLNCLVVSGRPEALSHRRQQARCSATESVRRLAPSLLRRGIAVDACRPCLHTFDRADEENKIVQLQAMVHELRNKIMTLHPVTRHALSGVLSAADDVSQLHASDVAAALNASASKVAQELSEVEEISQELKTHNESPTRMLQNRVNLCQSFIEFVDDQVDRLARKSQLLGPLLGRYASEKSNAFLGFKRQLSQLKEKILTGNGPLDLLWGCNTTLKNSEFATIIALQAARIAIGSTAPASPRGVDPCGISMEHLKTMLHTPYSQLFKETVVLSIDVEFTRLCDMGKSLTLQDIVKKPREISAPLASATVSSPLQGDVADYYARHSCFMHAELIAQIRFFCLSGVALPSCRKESREVWRKFAEFSGVSGGGDTSVVPPPVRSRAASSSSSRSPAVSIDGLDELLGQ